MPIIPKINSFRKSILLYRGIRYRKGFGVHSPFVYNLITKVIEERCPYYCFDDIELVRKQLLFCNATLTLPERTRNRKVCRRTVGQVVAHEAIKPKHGALLFRLANYFKSKQILQLGCSVGIPTLYLTAYASEVHCIVLESVPELASVARMAFEKAACRSADLRVGAYGDLLPEALAEMPCPDLIYFDASIGWQEQADLFEACLQRAGDDTLFVFEGIRANRRMRAFWKAACQRAEVTISVDLYSMGLLFFNKKLHKRNYIVYF